MPALAAVIATDNRAGGLSADAAPMHFNQTARSRPERSETAKATGVAKTLSGSPTRAQSSSVVTAAVMASKEVNATTELRSMTGVWSGVMGRGGWLQTGVATAGLSGY